MVLISTCRLKWSLAGDPTSSMLKLEKCERVRRERRGDEPVV
jgi:hypothetical protein